MFEQAYFQNDDAAREHLESIRWPEGPVCPHCGCIGNITALNGKRHRPGLYKCNDCRKQFTVTVGTVFERSKIALHKWFQVVYLMCSSKKGMSSHQIHRMIGVTYKTAWFMTHRIREAMKDGTLVSPMGGEGEIVEVDETFWGLEPGKEKAKKAWHHKMKIVSLVERDGRARSFHVDRVNGATLKPLLKQHIAENTAIMTDEAGQYRWVGSHFASHDVVTHSAKEYARGNAHTNTVEGFFSVMKRGLIGTYHHVGYDHLDAYLSEFDFRYNYRKVSDTERTMLAMKGIEGKRLYYRGTVAWTA